MTASPLPEGPEGGRPKRLEEFEFYEALEARLLKLHEDARSEKRGLDALDLLAARDCVEQLRTLMVAVRNHHADRQHVAEKLNRRVLWASDRSLYEAAGLAPVVEPPS